jgi:hypothetical protein
LESWYPIDEVDEIMECRGCLSTIQPPIDLSFHYRLNELVVRGVEQGVVPVILTTHVLASLANKSFLHVPNLELARSEQKVDIDIVASIDGAIALVECKDLRKGQSPETLNEICEQLTDIVDVALNIRAKAVFLSILANSIPAEIQDFIAEARIQNPGLPIHLFSGEELSVGYIPSDKEGRRNKTLDDFLDDSIAAKHNGWIEDVDCGERIQTY